jgi:hypothetical protein
MNFDEELSRIEEIKKVNKIKEHSQVSIAFSVIDLFVPWL